jgi:hypothetical protein
VSSNCTSFYVGAGELFRRNQWQQRPSYAEETLGVLSVWIRAVALFVSRLSRVAGPCQRGGRSIVLNFLYLGRRLGQVFYRNSSQLWVGVWQRVRGVSVSLAASQQKAKRGGVVSGGVEWVGVMRECPTGVSA